MTGFAHDPSPPVYTPSGLPSPDKPKKVPVAVPVPVPVPAFPRASLGERQDEIDREEEMDEIRREIQHLNTRLDTMLSTQFLVSGVQCSGVALALALALALCRTGPSRAVPSRVRGQLSCGSPQLVTSVFCLAAVTVSTVWSRGRQ